MSSASHDALSSASSSHVECCASCSLIEEGASLVCVACGHVHELAAFEPAAAAAWRNPAHFPQPPPRQSLGRRNLDFDEDSAEARKLVESAAATVSAERQEARVAEATQRALTRLNELESAAAAAERRVRGAEEREATLRRVVDAAKADVRSCARPEPCVGWLATLAMLFLAFGAGVMVQTVPTHVVTH